MIEISNLERFDLKDLTRRVGNGSLYVEGTFDLRAMVVPFSLLGR
jgi:hypothetical protein